LVDRLIRNNKRAISLTFTSCDLSRSSEGKSLNCRDLTFSLMCSKILAGVQKAELRSVRKLPMGGLACWQLGLESTRKIQISLVSLPLGTLLWPLLLNIDQTQHELVVGVL